MPKKIVKYGLKMIFWLNVLSWITSLTSNTKVNIDLSDL